MTDSSLDKNSFMGMVMQWMFALAATTALVIGASSMQAQQMTPAPAANYTVAPGIAAVQAQQHMRRASGPEDEAHAATTRGGEGIKVHGHWVMDFKNPDGTLARHVEFENSLVTPSQGDLVLSKLLTGQMVAADWAIVLNFGGNLQICGGSSQQTGCAVVTSLSGPFALNTCASGFQCVPGLTMAYIAPAAGAGAGLRLQGNFTATVAGTIHQVDTWIGNCSPGTGTAYTTASPAACLASTYANTPASTFFNTNQFTSTVPSLAIAAGQSVLITVTISFS